MNASLNQSATLDMDPASQAGDSLVKCEKLPAALWAAVLSLAVLSYGAHVLS